MTNQRSQRDHDIIEHYRRTINLSVTGRQFSLSVERVRQIVSRHEQETGISLPRCNRPAKPKIQVACPSCGRVAFRHPWEIRNKSFLCLRCAPLANAIPDEKIDLWIEQYKWDRNWTKIAVAEGRPKKGGCSALQEAVYNRLIKRRDAATIDDLWPNGIPMWLINRW